MIQTKQLTKWYGPTLAVDHLSIDIPAGQIVGFLGPNGAGKSTTLRMLTGFVPPTAGAATIDGHDVTKNVKAVRAAIGYLPESTPLYPEMRVEEYLHFRGKLYGMDRTQRRQRIDIVVDRCGLSKVRRRTIAALSKGNRQRVGLAQALLHDPRVLILDEPTAGLDPNQIGHVRELIRELRGEHTIMLSTHILPEIEKVADHVMIIASGRIVAQGSPDALRKQVGQSASVRVEAQAAGAAVKKCLGSLPGVAKVHVQDQSGWCHAVVEPTEGKNDAPDMRQAVGQAIIGQGWSLRELGHVSASLEQFFVQITAQQEQSEVSPSAA